MESGVKNKRRATCDKSWNTSETVHLVLQLYQHDNLNSTYNLSTMKLKLSTAGAAGSPPPATQSAATPTPASGGLKLKINLAGGAGSPPPATRASAILKPTKAPKAASGSKKRQRDDDAAQEGSSAKKPATATIRLSQNKASLIGRSTTLSLKARQGSISTPTTTRLKVKVKGKVPPRPLGVGYDSDAEDAEADPAMEEHFILRMAPGDDCDYLRQAIDERKIGIPLKEGGANVSMRFWRGDGRRASINIRGNLYAAVLVDLPCIVETMKSWDKRGWWKSADICQMLMVYRKIGKLEDGQDCALPPEVDEKTWQWPHGLTPPMYNVRKRRFRKRVSHRTIEAAEQEVERLLAADRKCKDMRGVSSYEVVDLDQMREEEEEEEDAEFDEEADAEGEPDEEIVDDTALLDSIMAGLDEEDMVAEMPTTASGVAAAADLPTPTVEAEVLQVVDEATSPEVDATGVTEAEDEDESEEDEDDEDGEEEEEDDEEAKERAQEMAQQRDEIAYLEKEISMQREAYAKQANPLLKKRLLDKIKSLEADVQIKKRSLGVADDDA